MLDSAYASNHDFYALYDHFVVIEYDPDGDGFTDVTWDIMIYDESNPDVPLDVSCPTTSLYDEGYFTLDFGSSAKDITNNGGSFNTGVFIIYCDSIYPDGTSNIFYIMVEVLQSDMVWEVIGDVVAAYDPTVTTYKHVDYDVIGTLDGVEYNADVCSSTIKSQFYDVTHGGNFYLGDTDVRCKIYLPDGTDYNFIFNVTILTSDDNMESDDNIQDPVLVYTDLDLDYGGYFVLDENKDYMAISVDGATLNVFYDDEKVDVYELAIPNDVKSAIYVYTDNLLPPENTNFDDNFSLPNGINPTFINFSHDGLFMFVYDAGVLHTFSLSTPFDTTLITYLDYVYFEYSTITDIIDIAFSSDGMTMFLLSDDEKEIIQYSLSKRYDLTFSTLDIIVVDQVKSSGGGCNDCTPPTLGLDKNMKRIVDYGFSYNDNITQVEYWHTPFPLINATVGDTNLVEIIIYENGGINNMERVQFGLGAEDIGQSLSTLEVLVDVELETFGTLEDIEVKEITITDKNNLIDNDTVSASAYVVKCQNDSLVESCVKIDLEYSYREATFNHIMVVNAEDKKHNSQNFWFNDGVQVLGESINESPTFIMQNKNSNQQTDDIFLTLTLVDKFTETWVDKYGIEYLQVLENDYSRITPLEKETCDNTPWSILNNPDRRSCQFKMLYEYELDRVTKLANEYYN